MRPQYSITTRDTACPIPYAYAADHLRVDSSADMEYIEGLIAVAGEYVSSVTGRSAGRHTWMVVADSWTALTGNDSLGTIRIGRVPLISVSSVKYYALDAAALTTISANDYRVITTTEPGIIQPVGEWPDADERADAIQIAFIAGHNDGNPAPPVFNHAIKMLVAHLYEERKPVAFSSCSEIPFTLSNLIEHHRMEGRFG